jgi:hypothetical protein
MKDLYENINKFNECYCPRTILVNDENSELLADSHNNFNIRQNYFSQLLNVHTFNHVRQMEIQTAEPLIPEPSTSEVETAITI